MLTPIRLEKWTDLFPLEVTKGIRYEIEEDSTLADFLDEQLLSLRGVRFLKRRQTINKLRKGSLISPGFQAVLRIRDV